MALTTTGGPSPPVIDLVPRLSFRTVLLAADALDDLRSIGLVVITLERSDSSGEKDDEASEWGEWSSLCL